MVSVEVIRRFVAQIKNKHPKLNETTIEKDFYLTLLLNEISKSIEEDKLSPFSMLVFKGGTLLTRTHLNYHRISEDLDFTYLDNKKLESLSSKQRKRTISSFTDKLVEEINKISKKFNLDFSANKKDKAYCKVMDRKKVYLFKICYMAAYGAKEPIKFEVNFNDELICPPIFENIQHLFDSELVKDLEFIEGIKIEIKKNILCYDLREIAMEKIRALLTRAAVKERDLFDLFLISKKINIEELDKKRVVEKVIKAKSFTKNLSEKIRKNLEMLAGGGYGISEEKSRLALIDIEESEYISFKKKVIPMAVDIGKTSLLKL